MIVLGIIITTIGMILYAYDYLKEKSQMISFWGGAIAAIGIMLICSLPSETEPTALDVYRNKTTLQITYVDSIPTDTVVVFKEKYK